MSDGLRAGLGINAAAYALAAIGLNVQFGYAGLWNFGQAGFVLVGAYGTAIAVDSWGLPLGLAIVVGILASLVLGLILGIPTLRLRGDYLAIVTISAAEILRIAANSRRWQSVTGGPQGLKDFAGGFYDLNPFSEGRYGIEDVTWTHNDLWTILVTWGIVFVATGVVALLVYSPWGRVVRAIREDEDAARSLGKNAYWYKMQALLFGGMLGGLAGIMLAIYRQFVAPEQFESSITFFAYAALILGGTARIFGPILGAIMFWFIVEGTQSFLIQAIDNDFLFFGSMETTQAGPVRFMTVGLIIMLLVIFRPQGVLGSRREVMLSE